MEDIKTHARYRLKEVFGEDALYDHLEDVMRAVSAAIQDRKSIQSIDRETTQMDMQRYMSKKGPFFANNGGRMNRACV